MRSILLAAIALPLVLAAFTTKKIKPQLPGTFALIPAGTITLPAGSEEASHNQAGNRISLASFYISKYEVTNQQYRQFYEQVAPSLPDAEKNVIACDSLGWNTVQAYSAPLARYYYRHPAYNNYPAVNIPYEGALAYCQWLEDKLRQNNPGFEVNVNLPSKEQWIYAGQGGRSQAMYPWGNFYLRNRKGEFLCNFRKVGDQAIVRNRQTGQPEVKEYGGSIAGGLNDRTVYTAEVKSFYPNDFGLYNICGNAAEMILEKGVAMGGSWNDYGGDVHIRSEASYERSQPTIGFRPVITVTEKRK